ncbi:non-ribosomal peptide synthetase [Umezawaea sp. Da 62-37]|uniref:non-ribosomal peptide synthetase n=1 Tax=Umezawaea sp. Da 62-37 TaxID=3075927 RepID=UPI0028F6CD83|nr:non-ribosomal peptide synthetase [Umezawaea sp. Da 62-37]WNV87780.1 amino acid adenylation domain-containing protein [Umezawaea sp. Da 62-37]
MQSLETRGQLKVAAARRPREGAFWRGELASLPERVGFPAGDRPGAVAVLDLDGPVSAWLDKLTRGQDAALQAVLAAAVGALLNRYTGAGECALATPPRNPESLARMLVLRLTVTADTTFRGLLAEARTRLLAAWEHEDYPLELLAAEFGAAGSDDGHPFADVAVGSTSEAHPIGFAFARTSHGLRLELRHRHTDDEARRLLGHCATLLERVSAEPDAPLVDIDLRTDADRALIARANDTAAPFEDTVRLDELFSRQVAKTPDAVAVVGSLSYAELDARANRLAHTLRGRGVGPGDMVAVLADRSIEMLVAIHAVLKAGGAYLPIDPGYPRDRIAYVLHDSAAPLVLTQARHAGLVDGVEALDLDDEDNYAQDTRTPPVTGDARDLAYVIYTSGSTGNPKGVRVEHRSVVNRIHWMQRAYPITDADVLLQKTPTSFDVSVWELFWWMFAGASVCLAEPGVERDPEELVAVIERARVTTVHFVPSMLGGFVDFVEAAGVRDGLATLRTVFASGEALAPHHVHRFTDVVAGARLVNLYGPTEATVDVTHHACAGDERRVPIGRPIDNTRIHVLDGRSRPQPVGVPGELCIAGVGLARGYLGRPELTSERFATAPHTGEDRVYRTGDLARWLPDGTIEYLGRMDHQVKVRGYRVELGEIEQRLREHPAVKDAVVVTRTAPDGQTHLRGYVLSSAAVDESDLRAHLAVTLPDYMVPPRVLTLDAFPLSPNGKLDRRALPEPTVETTGHVEPGTPVEIELARIWAEVLGYERIGAHDNFFASGGNSIHFVTVLAKARAVGIGFTFQQFFANPTVAELARSVAEGAHVAERPVGPFELLTPADRERVPAGVESAYPLTQLQAGLVFQSELSHGTAEYHDILSYMIKSPFDTGRFEEAVRILVRRNPIFRTGYHLTGFDEYLQLVHEEAPLPLEIADLRDMSGADQEAWYRDWAAREKAHRFVWSEPGLVRLHVHVLADDLYRYSLSQHNSALDGWSITLVHTTLFDIYYRLLNRHPLPETEVANHARTYVALERASLADDEHRAYWTGLLEDGGPTELPRTRRSAEADVFPVVFHEVEFPRGLPDRIVALADRLSVPVKNVLMAAHAKVLALVSGEDDVITGYEHSGRPEAEDATRAIGLFLNTVPFRVRMTDGSWEDLVRQVYRSETELLPARRYPMAQVKHDLGTQAPLFETAFNFTHFTLLKQLDELPGFELLDVRANSETEFVLRAEFSRHFASDEVRLSLHYHAHLFEPRQIARMGGYYVTAFERMTADPTAPHHLASLLSDVEIAEASEPVAAPVELVADPTRPWRAEVVDRHGLPVPAWTPGDIVLTDGAGRVPTGVRGRRTPDGLDVLGPHRRRTFGTPATAEPEADSAMRPTTAVQRRIAEVWARVLDVPLAEITLEGNFFRLGGGSLSAMRVAMELEGLVSLTDLMRNSALAALSAVAEAKLATPVRKTGLLHALSTRPDQAECALVCFPYAGGNAVNFEPLARELDADGGVAVYGVELPGHDASNRAEPLASIRDVARRVADEVRATVAGPVMLWGHCVGSAIAVETARLLEADGARPVHVFAGGKLLHSPDTARQGIEQVDAMSDQDIVRWLVDVTGLTEFDALSPEQAAFVAGIFRHDSRTANEYLAAAVEKPDGRKLGAPLSVVYATDDPLTPDFARRSATWSLFSDDIHVAEVGEGGHYFCGSAPERVAELVADRWRETRTEKEQKH